MKVSLEQFGTKYTDQLKEMRPNSFEIVYILIFEILLKLKIELVSS